MKIYTRTGDKGKTSLMGGKRVLKSDARVESYGTVDELNSVLGVVLAYLPKKTKLRDTLEEIQHDLFDIGSYLSHPQGEPIPRIPSRVRAFEALIDGQTEQLPPLRNFILPGGSAAGAFLHQSRTVCRRAERKIVTLLQKEDVDENVLIYMNRLSDLLFSTARIINQENKKQEIIWINHTK